MRQARRRRRRTLSSLPPPTPTRRAGRCPQRARLRPNLACTLFAAGLQQRCVQVQRLVQTLHAAEPSPRLQVHPSLRREETFKKLSAETCFYAFYFQQVGLGAGAHAVAGACKAGRVPSRSGVCSSIVMCCTRGCVGVWGTSALDQGPQVCSACHPPSLPAQGSRQQLFAANALKAQGWRFHTQFQAWFARQARPRLAAPSAGASVHACCAAPGAQFCDALLGCCMAMPCCWAPRLMLSFAWHPVISLPRHLCFPPGFVPEHVDPCRGYSFSRDVPGMHKMAETLCWLPLVSANTRKPNARSPPSFAPLKQLG